jgi:hypothetical protein
MNRSSFGDIGIRSINLLWCTKNLDSKFDKKNCEEIKFAEVISRSACGEDSDAWTWR